MRKEGKEGRTEGKKVKRVKVGRNEVRKEGRKDGRKEGKSSELRKERRK